MSGALESRPDAMHGSSWLPIGVAQQHPDGTLVACDARETSDDVEEDEVAPFALDPDFDYDRPRPNTERFTVARALVEGEYYDRLIEEATSPSRVHARVVQESSDYESATVPSAPTVELS